jgi:hypothetical protein
VSTTEDTWAEERLFRVVLNMDGGDWVELDSFHTEEEAETCAREMAELLAAATEWPRIRGRWLRPETITSIEIAERRRYGGSQARAAAFDANGS